MQNFVKPGNNCLTSILSVLNYSWLHTPVTLFIMKICLYSVTRLILNESRNRKKRHCNWTYISFMYVTYFGIHKVRVLVITSLACFGNYSSDMIDNRNSTFLFGSFGIFLERNKVNYCTWSVFSVSK
jgi:hypothetical protein